MPSMTETVVVGGIVVLAIGAAGFLAGKKIEDIGGDLASSIQGGIDKLGAPVRGVRNAGQGVATGFNSPVSQTEVGFFSSRQFLESVPVPPIIKSRTVAGEFTSGGTVVGRVESTTGLPKSVPHNTGPLTGPIKAGNTRVALGMAGRDTVDFLTFKTAGRTLKAIGDDARELGRRIGLP